MVCPAGESAAPLFRIVEGFEHPLIGRYERFLAADGIRIAGLEFILDRQGRAFPYDANTNTDHNPEAGAVAGLSGMRAVARYPGSELGKSRTERVRAAPAS